MSAVEAEVLDVFRAEANERLDRMVELMVAIEDGSAPADAIDLLFRDVHSIKGSAGMVGYGETRTIAHGLEDRLGEARTGDTLAGDMIEALLGLTDDVRRSLAGGDVVPSDRGAPAAVSATGTEGPAPIAGGRTIRMPAEKVDRLLDAVGESVLQMRTIEQVVDISRGDEHAEWELSRGTVLLDALQRVAIDMRTLPLASIIGRYPRAIRELALAHGKEVVLETSGMDAQLDRVILDGIAEAIAHLLSNAVAHGIESPDERERAGKPRSGGSSCGPSSAEASSRSRWPTTAAASRPRCWHAPGRRDRSSACSAPPASRPPPRCPRSRAGASGSMRSRRTSSRSAAASRSRALRGGERRPRCSCPTASP